MNYLEDVIRAVGHGIRQTKRSLMKNPAILLVPLIGSLIYSFVRAYLARVGGVFVGFIDALIYSFVLSFIFMSYYQTISFDRFSFKQTSLQMVGGFTWDVYSILFALMLVRIVGSSLGQVYAYLMIVISVVFNPIGEQIYLGRKHYTQNIADVWAYMKKSWYIWIPINALFIVGLHFLGKHLFQVFYLPSLFETQMGAAFPRGLSWQPILRWAAFQIILSIYILFRGHLYDYSRLGNRRKREFMKNFE